MNIFGDGQMQTNGLIGLPRGLLASRFALQGSSSPHVPRPKTRLDDPTMNVSYLPIELVQAIASWLYKMDRFNKEMLRRMSLVCRAWRPVACEHLYRRLMINQNKVVQMVDDLHGDTEHVLSRYLRELWIHLTNPDEGDREALPASLVPKLLCKLPHIQALELVGFPFQANPMAPPSLSLPSKLPLLHIDYDNVRGDSFGTLDGLIGLLDTFQSIDTVHIDSPNWYEEFYDVPGACAKVEAIFQRRNTVLCKTKIRSVVVNYWDSSTCEAVAILEILRRLPHVQSLESLNMMCSTLEEFLPLCALWQVASGISCLEFGISEEMLQDEFRMWQANASKISQCTSLRSLTLHICIVVDPHNDNDDTAIRRSIWSRTISILSHVSPSLTHLTLKLQGDIRFFKHQFHASERRGAHLDNVLLRLPDLQSLVISLEFVDHEAGYGILPERLRRPVEEELEKSLPRFQKGGVLQFKVPGIR